MMFRSRSCVIGRGVTMFSIWSAIAFASKMPTQIGRTRSPSLSLRMTMGMLVIGSTIRPLMVISINMALTQRTALHSVSRNAVAAFLATHKRCRCLDRVGHLASQAVRPAAPDPNPHGPSDPGRPVTRCIGRRWKCHYGVPHRPSGQLARPSPVHRIDEHRDLGPDRLRMELRLNLPLQRL